jgi:hypothetical protein
MHPLCGVPFWKAYPIFTPFKSCLGGFPWLGEDPDKEEERQRMVSDDASSNTVTINGKP